MAVPAYAQTAKIKPGRHRLDAGRHRPGADDDHSGPGAVLCRHGAQEERARHHGAVVSPPPAGVAALGRRRLFARLHRRRQLSSAASGARFSLRGMALGAISPLARYHSGKPVHDLPDDLRHHHGGAGRGLGRGSHALFGLPVVLRVLADLGLCADRPLGVGRRIPRPIRHDRFRRRAGGASQCRRRRSGRRPGSSARAAAMAAKIWRPTI